MNAGSAGVPPAMSAKRESKVALLFEVEGVARLLSVLAHAMQAIRLRSQ